MICGVQQGSVLGRTLWNIFYDDLLRVIFPPGTSVVAFTDDVAVLAVTHNTPLLQSVMNSALETVFR